MHTEIVSRNDEDEYHGYQEHYYTGPITFRGRFYHNDPRGYTEWHLAAATIFCIT